MKSWKIHLVWAGVTLIAAGGWGQWITRRNEAESRSRETALEARLVEARAPRPASISPVPGVETAPTPPSTVPLPQAVSSGSPTFDVVLQLRAQLNGNDARKKWEAFGAILKLPPGPDRLDLLREALRCTEEGLRRNCLYEIQKQKIAGLTSEILNLLASDPSIHVRKVAADVLGELGGTGAVESLLKAFHDDKRLVQVAAATALLQLGQPGPVSELIPQLASELDNPDGAVRREATERLSSLNTPLALSALVRALKDTNGDVRHEAVVGLGDLQLPEVIPLLESALKDPNEDVREAAQEALDMLKKGPGK